MTLHAHFDPRTIPYAIGNTILPSQFVAPADLTNTQRLVLALVEDAWGVLWKYRSQTGRRAQRLYMEAEEWMLSDDRYYGTFIFCCKVLGWEPDAVREGMRRRLASPLVEKPGEVIFNPSKMVRKSWQRRTMKRLAA